MTRKTLWRPVALALLLGMHTAWADMTDVQAKALAVSAYRHAGSRSGTSALETLMRAADGGAPAAQYWLGAYFDSSHLYVKANYWFGKAAEQGLSDAQFNLGVHYANGRGVPRDYAKANYWYAKAAEQGYADAQNNLGFDYYNGHGVPQDTMRAIYWWRKAAAQGSRMAERNIQIAERGTAASNDAARAVTYTDTCVNASCVRRYSDGRVIRYTACLNPADGLPMNDPNQLGGCGGTDSDGNFYGTGS